MDLERLRDTILLAVLPNVVFDGWTGAALRAAITGANTNTNTNTGADAETAGGLDQAAMERAFPEGIPALVAWFGTWADREMTAALARQDLTGVRAPDRLARAIEARLVCLAPHKEAVRRTVAWSALPGHLPTAAASLARTVDTLWTLAGDRSTDFSYYTKRAMLAAVLSATVLYWLEDDSVDGADTRAFITRCLANTMALARTSGRVGSIGRLVEHLPSPFRFAARVRQGLEQKFGRFGGPAAAR